MKIIVWALIILLVIIVGPLLTLWSLNTLFPALSIPYTIETWLAVVVLGGVFKTKITRE